MKVYPQPNTPRMAQVPLPKLKAEGSEFTEYDQEKISKNVLLDKKK
jgi:hypothetical protein